ncbi:MAG: DUF5123 domain-containing protein [Candidatus Marinimicrobia bacterium]|nr:DUF5123 domain-containing protein [Candidatus Neomarinimicrobiota bacterium]MCF7828918.1 DUF5123 domain-containing protein [Candidatus Neomarinimicrobiota bacterium]MCF7879878.1 DUF5123 domain-containing protein [Candidatus Neomarinimicrobiota bacterium]
MGNAQPGDTLIMRNGYWTDQYIRYSGEGIEGAPIVLRAEDPGRVLLNGTSVLRIDGAYLVVDGLYFKNGYTYSSHVIKFEKGTHHSRLTNTAIENYNPPSDIDNKWISVYGFYNRVDHCYMAGKRNGGTTLTIWLSGTSNNKHRIDHNYFGNRPELGENGGETIRIGTSDYSMSPCSSIVEYNYFEHCDGEVEIISNKSGENIYRYNTFYESAGALTLRHGNDCEVYGNFFIGNGKYNTGGVRIIGERHRVVNNYFERLNGTSLKSALPIMNGVPNSPLNRYFQVKNAVVAFNTFVDCQYSMILGAGADSERTLPPEDCIIANNIVDTYRQVITKEDEPVNMIWEGNIMHGTSLGIENPGGISEVDPELTLGVDSLWRITESSPAYGAAAGEYSWVTTDMDGQSRTLPKDVGADQVSGAEITNRPLTPNDNVGPTWYPAEPEVHRIPAALDTLRHAIETFFAGDTIELITFDEPYQISEPLVIDKHVIFKAADELDSRPVIRNITGGEGSAIFQMTSRGKLYLKGVTLDGLIDSPSPARYLFITDSTASKSYSIIADDCLFKDVGVGDEGNFLRGFRGTFADSLIFSNCLFTNAASAGFRMNEEADGSGEYNAKYIKFENCTFWNMRKSIVDIYGGDDVPFTPSPTLVINHCTVDNAGYEDTEILKVREMDFISITNTIFSNSPAQYTTQLYGMTAYISHSDTFNTGPVPTHRNAEIRDVVIDIDPLYAEPGNGDFTLTEGSHLYYDGNDGSAMGDLRWALYPPVSVDDDAGNSRPAAFRLAHTYPNPFNGGTTITYHINEQGYTALRVYDIRGMLRETLFTGMRQPGKYHIQWLPGDLASGTYFLELRSGARRSIQKVLYLK